MDKKATTYYYSWRTGSMFIGTPLQSIQKDYALCYPSWRTLCDIVSGNSLGRNSELDVNLHEIPRPEIFASLNAAQDVLSEPDITHVSFRPQGKHRLLKGAKNICYSVLAPEPVYNAEYASSEKNSSDDSLVSPFNDQLCLELLFDAIWVPSQWLKKKYEDLGVRNVSVVRQPGTTSLELPSFRESVYTTVNFLRNFGKLMVTTAEFWGGPYNYVCNKAARPRSLRDFVLSEKRSTITLWITIITDRTPKDIIKNVLMAFSSISDGAPNNILLMIPKVSNRSRFFEEFYSQGSNIYSGYSNMLCPNVAFSYDDLAESHMNKISAAASYIIDMERDLYNAWLLPALQLGARPLFCFDTHFADLTCGGSFSVGISDGERNDEKDILFGPMYSYFCEILKRGEEERLRDVQILQERLHRLLGENAEVKKSKKNKEMSKKRLETAPK
jgi:hypothetical protein